MSNTTRNRLVMVLVATFIALLGYTVWSAHDAMYPTNYTSECEVGILNGTYGECK